MSLRRSSWDMRAFFKAKGQRDGDEIAATAAWRLEEHLPKGTKLRLSGRKKAVPRDEGSSMKVWIYRSGDDLMVFASQEPAQAWFDQHDPEGVAFAYDVIG